MSRLVFCFFLVIVSSCGDELDSSSLRDFGHVDFMKIRPNNNYNVICADGSVELDVTLKAIKEGRVCEIECGPFEQKVNNKCVFVPGPEACKSLPGNLVFLGGQCRARVYCGPFEHTINNKCVFVPGPKACKSLPGDLIFLEGQCRARDYCGPDKIIIGDRCAKKDLKGLHCRFEIFGINSCIDYRGSGWDEDKALKLCQGLNSFEMEAKLEPGPCELKTYDTLCRVNMSNPGPYISEKEQIQGISWGASEHAYLFAVGLPEWVCDSAPFIIGDHSQKQQGTWPEKADWLHLDENLGE